MRRLSLIWALVLMSAMARSTCASLTDATPAPPTPSAAFSLLASQRAAALVAPLSDKANTDAPRAAGVMKASAWRDTKRSACTRLALRTRSCRGTKKSASRVSMARMPGTLLSRSRSFSATASTTSFSRSPLGPMAPGSSPPWPGSSATTTSRSMLRCSSGSSTVAGGVGVDWGGGVAPGAGMAGAPLRWASSGAEAGGAPACRGLSMRPMKSPRASRTLWAAWLAACSRSRISASSGSAASVG